MADSVAFQDQAFVPVGVDAGLAVCDGEAALRMIKPEDNYVLPEASGDHLDDMHAITVHVAEGVLLDFVRSCGSSPAPTLVSLAHSMTPSRTDGVT